MPASENSLRPSLAAWLRWHAPSAEERNRAPESCHPLLDAMARASGVQAVARLATEIENADERFVALAADYEAVHDKLRAEIATADALAGELAERLESLLIATAPGLTTHLDHEKDETRALLSRTKAGCLARRPGHG